MAEIWRTILILFSFMKLSFLVTWLKTSILKTFHNADNEYMQQSFSCH